MPDFPRSEFQSIKKLDFDAMLLAKRDLLSNPTEETLNRYTFHCHTQARVAWFMDNVSRDLAKVIAYAFSIQPSSFSSQTTTACQRDAAQFAKEDGITLEQYYSIAVAEKVQRDRFKRFNKDFPV